MAVPMDPYSAAISGAMQGLTGGSATADQKSQTGFDNSGWNINFGSGSIDAQRSQSGTLSEYLPYMMVGAALLVVWRFTRKK